MSLKAVENVSAPHTRTHTHTQNIYIYKCICVSLCIRNIYFELFTDPAQHARVDGESEQHQQPSAGF